MKTIQLTKDPYLDFDHRNHRYTYSGMVCESVTTLIKKYSPPFDELKWSAIKAEQRGVSQGDILAEWKAKADKASAQGTIVHGEAEKITHQLKQTKCLSFDLRDAKHPKVKALFRWFGANVDMGFGQLFSEFRMVWPEFLVAGTCDLIATNYQGGNAIIDFKTNEEIDPCGFNNMLAPFTRGKLKLKDCNFTAYALQLTLYQRILEAKYDFIADSLVIVHLEDSGNYTEYPVHNYRRYVDKILELKDPNEYAILVGQESATSTAV